MSKHTAAFPSPGVVIPGLDPNARQQGAYEGMSLRDYFAAKAMQAAFTHPGQGDLGYWITTNVAAAYQVADAMLAERSKARQP